MTTRDNLDHHGFTPITPPAFAEILPNLERIALIEKAVKLGLSRNLAKKKATGWLSTFVEVETNNQARNQRELGSAGLQAGAIVRKNFGV